MSSRLKHFLIGSSLPVVLPFFLKVGALSPDKPNYSYQTYSIVAPLYLGLMNMWFPNDKLTASLVSSSIVVFAVWLLKLYNFTTYEDWFQYVVTVLILHLLVFNGVIYYLEKRIE